MLMKVSVRVQFMLGLTWMCSKGVMTRRRMRKYETYMDEQHKSLITSKLQFV